MTTRICDCPHKFPFCACALGLTGANLAYHSRLASAIIGWPTKKFDEDALAKHNARMAAAREEREAIEAQHQGRPVVLARVDKPRIPLGTRLGGPECIPCQNGAGKGDV